MEKIRYRLVYNRRKAINNQGTALVQAEASLNGRRIYITTNVYLRPECWDKSCAQVCNHPQATELNAMLYEFLINLQGVELSFWKRGIQPTLALLKNAVKQKKTVNMTFIEFARDYVKRSDNRTSTKENMTTTIRTLEDFRGNIDFRDITYSFLKEFERYLNAKKSAVNTIAKHMRQLRTLVNEAINEGYISQDSYPFRKYKIKHERGKYEFLTPEELRKLENLTVKRKRLQHILDAFLFCCYVGLRFSDFCSLNESNIITINGKKWLYLKSLKTNIETRIPLHLLFDGKALAILNRYETIRRFARIGCNADVNEALLKLAELAKIKKHVTFHASRHTCATLLIHQGVPITTVQKLLGHTSVRTTEIYSEVLSSTIVRDLKNSQKKRKKSLDSPDFVTSF